VEIHSSEDDLTGLVLGVAEGKIPKSEVAGGLVRWIFPVGISNLESELVERARRQEAFQVEVQR
jgi:hypothetical protein